MTMTTVTEPPWMRLRASFGLRRKPQWPEPEFSIGTWYRKMGMSDCWEATGAAREAYAQLSKDIKRLLEERIDFLYEDEPESKTVTFHLYMIGRRRTSAKPTILFCCVLSQPRRRARDLIKESAIMDDYPGWALGDCSFPPDFDQPPMPLAKDDFLDYVNGIAQKLVLYKPSERAHGIQVFVKGFEDSEHTRTTTIGGFIRIEGQFYGLTVAHAFIKTKESPKSTNKIDFEFDLEDTGDDNDSDADELLAEATSRGSETPGSERSEKTVAFSSSPRAPEPKNSIDVYSSSRFMTDAMNNSPSGEPGDFNHAKIGKLKSSHLTDQLGQIEPHIGRSYYYDDHPANLNGLLTVFGDLTVSSADEILSSLDWALIRVRDSLLRTMPNLRKKEGGSEYLYHKAYLQSRPKDTAIVALTGSAGSICGILSGTPAFLNTPSSKKFQEVWKITLDGKVMDGDCGSWVLDAQNGAVYGHIVSGNPENGLAYIMPLYEICKEIRRRCETQDVELCLGPDSPLISGITATGITVDEAFLKALNEVNKLRAEVSMTKIGWEEERKTLNFKLDAAIRSFEDLKTECDDVKGSLEREILKSKELEAQNTKLARELNRSKRLLTENQKIHQMLQARLHNEASLKAREILLSANSQNLKSQNYQDLTSEYGRSSGRWSPPETPETSPPNLTDDTLGLTIPALRDYDDVYSPSNVGIQAKDSTMRSAFIDSMQPQWPLPYCVARVYIGKKVIELKRKLYGSDIESGRELIITDETGNCHFRHQIKTLSGLCYPSTSFASLKDENKFEVTFKPGPLETQSVDYAGTRHNQAPKYVFTRREDFMDFQGQVRGKDLVDAFYCMQIHTSMKAGAKKEVLKIWRDRLSNKHSISYYASQSTEPCHLEFPIIIFEGNSKTTFLSATLEFSKPSQISRTFGGSLLRQQIGYSTSPRSSVSSIFSSRSSMKSVMSNATSPATSFIFSNNFPPLQHSQSHLAQPVINQEKHGTQMQRTLLGEPLVEAVSSSMQNIVIKFLSTEDLSRFRDRFIACHRSDMSSEPESPQGWMTDLEELPESPNAPQPFTMPSVLPFREDPQW